MALCLYGGVLQPGVLLRCLAFQPPPLSPPACHAQCRIPYGGFEVIGALLDRLAAAGEMTWVTTIASDLKRCGWHAFVLDD